MLGQKKNRKLQTSKSGAISINGRTQKLLPREFSSGIPGPRVAHKSKIKKQRAKIINKVPQVRVLARTRDTQEWRKQRACNLVQKPTRARRGTRALARRGKRGLGPTRWSRSAPPVVLAALTCGMCTHARASCGRGRGSGPQAHTRY